MWIIKTNLGEQLTENSFRTMQEAQDFLFDFLLNEYGLVKNVLAVRGLYYVVPID